MRFIPYLKGWVLSLVVMLMVGCSSDKHCAPVVSLSGKGVSAREISKATKPQNYVIVQPGETLFTIAARNRIEPQTLALLNGVRPPYAVYPGQKLTLSAQLASPNRIDASGPHPRSLPSKPLSSSPLSSHKHPSETIKVAKTPVLAKQASLASSGVSRSTNKQIGLLQKPINRPLGNAIRWEWPVRGPLLRRFHQDGKGRGIDIGGNLGSSVKAAAKGVVVYSGNALKGYGSLIIIKHGEDYLSAYAHNRELKVKEGESVCSGQEIATMGKTDAEQVKLHFEIRYKGKPVDPIPYLPKH